MCACGLIGVRVVGMDGSEAAGRVLLSRGCGAVVLTLGGDGAAIITPGGFEHVPAPHVDKVVDTVGAGDAFVGGMALYLARALTAAGGRLGDAAARRAATLALLATPALRASVVCGAAVASDSVQRKGTQKSYPLRKDLPESLFTLP